MYRRRGDLQLSRCLVRRKRAVLRILGRSCGAHRNLVLAAQRQHARCREGVSDAALSTLLVQNARDLRVLKLGRETSYEIDGVLWGGSRAATPGSVARHLSIGDGAALPHDADVTVLRLVLELNLFDQAAEQALVITRGRGLRIPNCSEVGAQASNVFDVQSRERDLRSQRGLRLRTDSLKLDQSRVPPALEFSRNRPVFGVDHLILSIRSLGFVLTLFDLQRPVARQTIAFGFGMQLGFFGGTDSRRCGCLQKHVGHNGIDGRTRHRLTYGLTVRDSRHRAAIL